MINIKNLYHKFNPGKPNEVVALRHINLDILSKEFLIVVGANGSGKSTLLHLIAGSLFPTQGTIELDSKLLNKLPDYKRSKWIARVFQNPLDGTVPELSISENFRLAALRGKAKSLKIGLDDRFVYKVRDHIAQLGMGLENKMQQSMGSLSGGQRQALCLLMAVMADIKVLLLDEPTAALDPKSASVVLSVADKLIKEYRITALMVTHNLKEAFHYGSRIIQMHNGSIVKDIAHPEKSGLTSADLYSWFD